MEKLIESAKAIHKINPVSGDPAVFEQLDSLEISLPTDFRSFYDLCDGGDFWPEGQNRFTIFSIEQICGDEFFFQPKGKAASKFSGELIVFCELDDGNAIGFKKGSLRSTYPVLFLDHESYPNYEFEEEDLVATSFHSFIDKVLNCNGEWWW